MYTHICSTFLPKKKINHYVFILFLNETSWSHNVDRYYILENVYGCLKGIGLEKKFKILYLKRKKTNFFDNFLYFSV